MDLGNICFICLSTTNVLVDLCDERLRQPAGEPTLADSLLAWINWGRIENDSKICSTCILKAPITDTFKRICHDILQSNRELRARNAAAGQ